MDPTIIVASVAAAGSITCTYITAKSKKVADKTHNQLTINHHSSETPTVPDMFADLNDELRRLGDKIDHHILWHLDNRNN